MSDTNSPQSRRWFISGIYYPKPRQQSEIPDDERWSHLTTESLADVNSQLVGKPLLVDHPFDANGMPLYHREFGANYRGKIVHSHIRPDGRGYFIAEVPVDKSMKNRFFKKDLSRNKFSEFSICHSKDENGREVPDHIAILERGKARFPGCDMLDILKIPKKRHLQTSTIERIKNNLEEFRKNRDKSSRHQTPICINSRTMEGSGQVQDDAGAPGSGNQTEILRNLLTDPRYANNPDEVVGFFDHLLKKQDAVAAELEREKKEKQILLQEKYAKEEQAVKQKEAECIATWKDMINAPTDESVELTDEARALGDKYVEDNYQDIYGETSLAERERLATYMERMGRRIAACSRESIQKQQEAVRQRKEAAQSRRGSQMPISNYSDRFAPQKPASTPMKDHSKPRSDGSERAPSLDFLESLQKGIQTPNLLSANSSRSDLMDRYAEMEKSLQARTTAKRQRF